jgi:hypothetical protein
MMMRRSLWIMSLVLTLASCASTKPVSNVADLRGNISGQTLAEDTVLQLSKLFPPAKTQLYFTRTADDAFGRALVAGLREQGYAIEETAAHPAGEQMQHDGLPVAYIIDPIVGDTGYRVSLMVGNGVLSRAYSVYRDGSLSGGAWAYRE